MAKKINVKLILELRAAHMSRNQIAATRHISRNSVSDVFHIADSQGITYRDIQDQEPEQVYRMFYPDKHSVENMYKDPDYNYIHEELKRTAVTLKLLWKEYQYKGHSENAIPMGYAKFCQGYGAYTTINKLTNHLEHHPGNVCEVDWSGSKMAYVDPSTGELIPTYLFVATLPYSQYSYVEPCLDMKQNT